MAQIEISFLRFVEFIMSFSDLSERFQKKKRGIKDKRGEDVLQTLGQLNGSAHDLYSVLREIDYGLRDNKISKQDVVIVSPLFFSKVVIERNITGGRAYIKEIKEMSAKEKERYKPFEPEF